MLWRVSPPAGAGTQSTSKPPSMFRSQQATEEAYPDLGSMRRELERAQRERDKANLDREQVVFERDKAILIGICRWLSECKIRGYKKSYAIVIK